MIDAAKIRLSMKADIDEAWKAILVTCKLDEIGKQKSSSPTIRIFNSTPQEIALFLEYVSPAKPEIPYAFTDNFCKFPNAEDVIAKVRILLENEEEDYRDRVNRALGALDFFEKELTLRAQRG